MSGKLSTKQQAISSYGSIEKVFKGATKNKSTAKVVVIAMVCLIMFDLMSFGGNNIQFYSMWARCGRRPVDTQSWAGVAWYENAPLFTPFLRNKSLFCSPREAELRGYSANPHQYEFRYTTAEERDAYRR